MANDDIMTPEHIAKMLIGKIKPFIKEKDSLYDPFKGKGAFFNNFPKQNLSWWSEIKEGRNFFDCDGKVDWIISNPPYSKFTEVMKKSYEVADNICYLPENFSLAMCEFAWSSIQKPAKIFRYSVLTERDKIHPTQKPVKLFEWLLNKTTNENDLVLDCFSGSGTTAIACHRLKRRFICIEKDPEYAKASIKRLEDEQRQGVLL